MSISGLDVISSNAALQFSTKDWSYVDLKRILDVDHLIEGSYKIAEDNIQLMVKIVEAETGKIWVSKQFEESIDNLDKLQRNVTLALMDNLNIDISKTEKKRLTTDRKINFAAYEFLQKGKGIMRIKNDRNSLEQSKNFFYMALQSDPAYIEAYVALGEAVFNEITYASRNPIKGIKEVENYLKQAQELDPEKGEFYVHEGLLSIYNNDWEKAKKLIDKGILLSPNYSFAYLCRAWTFSVKKEHKQAIESIETAIQLDPLNLNYPFWKVAFLSFSGNYDRAETIIEPYFEIDTLKGFAMFWRGLSQIEQKKYEKASDYIDPIQPWCGWNGYSFAMSGDRDSAMKIINHALKDSDERYVSPAPISWIYIGLGEYEKAFEYLEEAYVMKDNYAPFLINSVIFDPIRGDTRFQELLVKMGLVD